MACVYEIDPTAETDRILSFRSSWSYLNIAIAFLVNLINIILDFCNKSADVYYDRSMSTIRALFCDDARVLPPVWSHTNIYAKGKIPNLQDEFGPCSLLSPSPDPCFVDNRLITDTYSPQKDRRIPKVMHRKMIPNYIYSIFNVITTPMIYRFKSVISYTRPGEVLTKLDINKMKPCE